MRIRRFALALLLTLCCCPGHAAACSDRQLAWLQPLSPAGAPVAEPIAAACKPWPYADGKLLAAVAYAISEYDALQGGRQVRILVAVVDARNGHVESHTLLQADEDAATRYGGDDLRLDTARYDLAPGRRAFALRLQTGYGPRHAEGGFNDTFVLLLPAGRELQVVLSDLWLSRWNVVAGQVDAAGDEVVESTAIKLAMGDGTHGGLRDLQLRATTSSGRVLTHTLQFDGTRYPTVEWERAYGEFIDAPPAAP